VLLRAADAAGLPRRLGRVVDVEADDADDEVPRAKHTDALSSLLRPLLNICSSALTSALPITPADKPDPESSN
jgi:hypothetical protein